MCDFDEFMFECGHAVYRLKCYCHFARNHPEHKCARVQFLRASWLQNGQVCEVCERAGGRINNGQAARPSRS